MSRGKFRARSTRRRSEAVSVAGVPATNEAPAALTPSETEADLHVADGGAGTADDPSAGATVASVTAAPASGSTATPPKDPRLGAFPHLGSFMNRARNRHGFNAAEVRKVAGMPATAKPAELLDYPGGLDALDKALNAASKGAANDD